MAGCPSSYTQYIHLHGSYAGPVHAHATLISGPVTLPTPDVDVTANGEGSLGFPLALNQPGGKVGDSYVHMTFSAPGITSQSLDVRVNAGSSYVPSITKALSYGWSTGFNEQWLPESTPGPHDAGGGTQIQVEGNFPSGCNYAFKDDFGQSLKVVKIETGRHVNEENEDGGVVRDLPDRAILQLNDDPRSTAVNETSGPFGMSTKLTLRTFRNSWGFNGVNSGEGAGTTDFSWSDFLRTFGSDDGDACVPILGCVRDPVALIAWHFISNKLEGQKGICFGWSTMALRFERGIERPTDYQNGARYSYDISNPEKEGPAIKQQLVRWQAAQQDMGWQEYKDNLEDDTPSLQQFHDQLRAALQSNDAVTLALHQGDVGPRRRRLRHEGSGRRQVRDQDLQPQLALPVGRGDEQDDARQPHAARTRSPSAPTAGSRAAACGSRTSTAVRRRGSAGWTTSRSTTTSRRPTPTCRPTPSVG